MESLTRTNLQRSLAVKSLTDLVRAKTSEDVFLLIDVSSSMRDKMRNGKTKISGLKEVVSEIRGSANGDFRIKMIAFGGYDSEGRKAYFVESVPEASGGTPLTEGINLATESNAGRAVIISDGAPNNHSTAEEAAGRFGGRIDVVYVGDPGDAGELFLRRLAESTGGTEFAGDLSQPKELGGQVTLLLTGDTL